jgi:RND family efflux transporter MFP subunit
MEYLFKEGAVSELQYDQAKTNYEVARVTFEAAAKLVDIQSPISGVVTSVDVSDGDFLSIGRQLATVATVDRLRVKFAVNAEDIRFFSRGAWVSVAAGNGRVSGEGAVTSISESADPVTRAFEVEVLVENQDGRFKVGTFARVDVALESMDGIIVVPRDALMTLDGQPVGYVVTNGRVDKRVLSLGTNLEGRVVVDSGLEIGDTLVTLGQSYLSDGVQVTIANLE